MKGVTMSGKRLSSVGLSEHETWLQLKPIYDRATVRRDGSRVAADVDLSPELCLGIMQHMGRRNIRQLVNGVVMDYQKDMASGDWGACFDPVIFRPDKSLMNAQHRCTAGYRSGCGLTGVVVVFDAPPDTAKSIDAGRKRNAMHTHGLSTAVTGAAGPLLSLENRGVRAFTRSQMAARYAQDAEMFDHYIGAFRARPVLREGHIAAAFIYAESCRETNHRELREIADDMTIGTQSMPHAKQIADYVVQRKTSRISTSSQTARCEEAKLILRVLQTYLLGTRDATMGVPTSLDWWAPRVKQADSAVSNDVGGFGQSVGAT